MNSKTDTLLTYNEAAKQPERASALLLKDAFPEEVRQMRGLEQLVIKGTKIKKLPAWLPELTQLMKIEFQGNHDKIISPATFKLLAKLPALQELIIESGQLPAEVGLLKGLTVLAAWGQKKLPEELFGLTNLVTLNLKDGWLKQVPDALANLAQLRDLTLSDCLLEEFPEVLFSLPVLERLDISGNYLRRLPNGNLPELRELILASTQLQAFPKQVLSMPKLEKLDVSKNVLNKLPDDMRKLGRLKELHLNRIGLTAFPGSVLDLTELTYLDLSENQIGKAMLSLSSLSRLQHLNLYSCRLTEFPTGITDMIDLKYLNLSANSIPQLPADIDRLTSLEELLVDGKGLSAYPEKLSTLKKLRWLDVGYGGDKGEVKKIMDKLPHCRCNLFEEEKAAEAAALAEQIVAAGLEGKEQEEYEGKRFAFVLYDLDCEDGFRVMVEADSVFELLQSAAAEMDMAEGEDPAEWTEYQGLPEVIRQQAEPSLAALLLYLGGGFDFVKDDDYESDAYLAELEEVMPEARFVFGWSVAPPRQDEAYAVVELTEE